MKDLGEFGALEIFGLYYVAAAAGLLLFRLASVFRRRRNGVDPPEDPSNDSLWQLFSRGLNPILAAALFPVFWPVVVILNVFIRWMMPNVLPANVDERRNTSFRDVSGAGLGKFKGREGETLCDLHPSGRITVDDVILEAVSPGEYIPCGTRVRVTGADGFRVVVENAE